MAAHFIEKKKWTGDFKQKENVTIPLCLDPVILFVSTKVLFKPRFLHLQKCKRGGQWGVPKTAIQQEKSDKICDTVPIIDKNAAKPL